MTAIIVAVTAGASFMAYLEGYIVGRLFAKGEWTHDRRSWLILAAIVVVGCSIVAFATMANPGPDWAYIISGAAISCSGIAGLDVAHRERQRALENTR